MKQFFRFLNSTSINKILLFFLMISNFCCYSSSTNSKQIPEIFRKNVSSVLENKNSVYNDYPKPPPLTDEILSGLLEELKIDSANYYLNQLSPEKMKSHEEINQAINYFQNNNDWYCLMAMSAHWNPDARIDALQSMNYLVKIRPLICTTKTYSDIYENNKQEAIKFLIFLLESNPIFISGSENATIHSIYIANIMWDLDLMTNEKIVNGLQVREWYKHDLQLGNAILQWKSHTTKAK